MQYNLITLLKERRPISVLNIRWRRVSIGMRRILSLFIDAFVYIYFMVEAHKAAYAGDYIWLFMLNIFVFIHFSALPLSMGKMVTGLRVLSIDKSKKRYLRNILVQLAFLFHCISSVGYNFAEWASVIIHFFLMADKSTILCFYRQTFIELLLVRTVVGPAGGTGEIADYK